MAFGPLRRELSATEIVNRAFGLYSYRFIELVTPFFIAGLVNGVARFSIERIIIRMGFRFSSITEPTQWLTNYLIYAVTLYSLLGVIKWIINTLASGVVIKYTSDLLEGKGADLKEGFNSTFTNLGSLLAAGLITSVLTVLGLICMILPGIILLIIFSLTTPVIIIEGKGALESLRRSRTLVDRRWGKTIAVIAIILLITIIANEFGEFIGGFLDYPINWVFSIVISTLVEPVYPIALTYLYYSMLIKEGKPVEAVAYRQPRERIESPERGWISWPPRPQPTPQPRIAFCYYCGQRLPPDAIFCPRCGRRVRGISTF